MEPAGRVRIGLKQIELRAFITEMLQSATNGWQRLIDGKGQSHEVEDGYWVATRPGDRVLFVQGTTDPRDWSSLSILTSIATFNLSTGKVHYSGSGIAALAVPPFNNALGITAIFVGLFSLLALFNGAPEAIVFLALSVGYFVWTRMRVRKLKRAIEAIAAQLKAQALR
jgi:hypothetical protein